MKDQSTNWEEEINRITKQRDRFQMHFSCVFGWLELLENGANLQPYFTDHKCSRIAIYGVGELGRVLLQEINQANVTEVSYFLDRSAERQRGKWGKPVYLPEEFSYLPEVDMVVVTALLSFPSIQTTMLQIRPEIPVVALDKIIEARNDEVWYDRR